MNMDDSRLIVRFQRLITEMLIEKRLGQRRPELTDELYQTWREVEQCGLKESPEYRDVLPLSDHDEGEGLSAGTVEPGVRFRSHIEKEPAPGGKVDLRKRR